MQGIPLEMGRIWNGHWPGGKAAAASAERVEEGYIHEDESQDSFSFKGIGNTAGATTLVPLPSRLTASSSAGDGSRVGRGASASLASALFTSDAKYISNFPALGKGKSLNATEYDTSVYVDRRKPHLPVQEKSSVSNLELPPRIESAISRSRGSDGSSSVGAISVTPPLNFFSKGSTPPIPEEPRNLSFREAQPILEYSGSHLSHADPKAPKEKWNKRFARAYSRSIKALLRQTWGAPVYDMFSEDDVKAFEKSISLFPLFFLDEQMETSFIHVQSRWLTCYYIALTFFWAVFMTITFGNFFSRTTNIRFVWALPYIVGMSTVLILTSAYLALVGIVAIQFRALICDFKNISANPKNQNAFADEHSRDELEPDKSSAWTEIERQASFNAKKYHIRWTILKDCVISIVIVMNFASWAVTYMAVGFSTLLNDTLHDETKQQVVSFYLRQDVFAVFCFFVVFHLVCPIRVRIHLLVLTLSLCFFWTNCILLSIVMNDVASMVSETILVTIVLGSACGLRSTMERMHRFAFFLRQRAKIVEALSKASLEEFHARSTTPVEELILLVNAAGLKLRIAGKELRYRKPQELVHAEGMLMRCLKILTARDDLFACVIDDTANEPCDVRSVVLTAFGVNLACRDVFKDFKRTDTPRMLEKKVSSFVGGTSPCLESTCSDMESPAISSLFAASPLDLWYIADNGGRNCSLNENDVKGFENSKDSMTGLMSVLPQPPVPRLASKWSARISVQWDLSMLEVNKFCNNCCLFYIGYDMLHYKITGFLCPNQVFINFLWAVQLMYQPALYHSHMHGAQVAHSVLWLARTLELTDILSPPELVSLIVASLCHDIGHQGRNNAFYTVTTHPLSIIYNDVAVLENFHACLTFKILQRAECDIFQELQPSHRMACRGHIIDLILATDMKLHFENVSKFKLRRSSPEFDKTQGDDLWQTLRMCMKGGDISHALLPWEDHVAWSYRAVSEFYQQGDEDVFAGRDVTPMCDRRRHAEFPKGQAGFIRFVVLPLYEEIDAVCSSKAVMDACLARAEDNVHKWNEAEEDPQNFQIMDQKQQETVKVHLAQLAVQKDINQQLSFRVMGTVQIVPPDCANKSAAARDVVSRKGGATSSNVPFKNRSAGASQILSRHHAAAGSMQRERKGEQTSDQRAQNYEETLKETSPQRISHRFNQGQVLAPAPQAMPSENTLLLQQQRHQLRQKVHSLPAGATLGAGRSKGDASGKPESKLKSSGGSSPQLESTVRE